MISTYAAGVIGLLYFALAYVKLQTHNPALPHQPGHEPRQDFKQPHRRGNIAVRRSRRPHVQQVCTCAALFPVIYNYSCACILLLHPLL